MKTLLICGYFAKANEKEVQAAARKPVEYSSNNYIRKLIEGFKSINEDVYVLSAPLIGSFPNASSMIEFKGFDNAQEECEYVGFVNVWGVRNYSRARSLKTAVHKIFSENSNESFSIIVCSVHTPFVECAAYAKRLRPETRICLIVPDLPQYMHLDSKASIMYRLAKAWDIERFNRFNRAVDSYVLLTECMKEKIDIRDGKYVVAEGLVEDGSLLNNNDVMVKDGIGDRIPIVYTGKTYEKFGIKVLLQAFMKTTNDKYELVICGSGDCDEYIKEQAKTDKRIRFLGQVAPMEAKNWIKTAKVLVNPRQNNEDYTKYSFPSKNLEYLSSGNAVVLYLLDGMKRDYAEFCTVPKDDSVEALAQAIDMAAALDRCTVEEKYKSFCEYSKSLYATEVCRKIIEFVK